MISIVLLEILMSSFVGPKDCPSVSFGQSREFTEAIQNGMEFIGPSSSFFSGETPETRKAQSGVRKTQWVACYYFNRSTPK